MNSRKTGLTFGLIAGAALAAYAVSKVSKDSVKELGKKVSDLRNSLTNQLTELKNIKRTDKRFI